MPGVVGIVALVAAAYYVLAGRGREGARREAQPSHATGIGTVIPSQYGRGHASCFDASSNTPMCGAVAFALAAETDPNKLRALAASVAGAGFPVAANTLLAKADSLG